MSTRSIDGVSRKLADRQPAPAPPSYDHIIIKKLRRRKHLIWLLWFLFIIPAVGGTFLIFPSRTSREQTANVVISEPKAEAQSQAVTIREPEEVSNPLQDFVKKLVEGKPVNVGIYVEDLKAGTKASHNSSQEFNSASLYKLFVANEIFRLVSEGKLSMDGSLTLKIAGDNPDTPEDETKTSSRSIRSCLEVMLTRSDNACGQALGTKIGWSRQNKSLKTQGYAGTKLNDPPKTTVGDVGLLLRRTYKDELVNPQSSQDLLALLKAQQIKTKLPKGLPAGTLIAHKTGELDGFEHDAGIVYGPKTTYIIVVMSGPWKTSPQARATIAELSRDIYGFLNN